MPDRKSAEISEKYAELSSILASEKPGGELVEVPRDFYTDLRELVNDLEAMLNQERDRGLNKRAARLQDMLDNIRKHSEKFYRFRVRKIFRLAHNSSGGGIRKKGLAVEEIEMLEGFLRILDRYSYLANFSRDEKEIVREIKESMAAEEVRERREERERSAEEGTPSPEDREKIGPQEETEEDSAPSSPDRREKKTEEERKTSDILELPMTEKGEYSEELPEKTALVRVLYDLPDIAGAGIDYRLKLEDIVVLPDIMARVLLKGGKVELIAYNL